MASKRYIKKRHRMLTDQDKAWILERFKEFSGGNAEWVSPRVFSKQMAAERLAVSPRTVQRMMDEGELQFCLVRGKRGIPSTEIERLARVVQTVTRARAEPLAPRSAAKADADLMRAATRKKR